MRPAHQQPSLNALRAFEATARLGSMTRAANALNVTHGAISRQVRQLETQLGLPLFLRTHGRLTLTTPGQQLADASQRALGQLYGAWDRLLSAQQSQPLTLGCTGSLLARWLIPRMTSLPEALSEMRLHMVSTDDAMDIAHTEIDAALVYLTPPWPTGYEVIALHPERFGPVMAPSLLAAHGLSSALTIDQLLTLPLLTTLSRPDAWPLWLQQQGDTRLPERFQQSFQHALYLSEAAEAGIGVALVPDIMATDALAKHRLVAPFPFIETDDRLCLIINQALLTHARSRADTLVNWAKRTLGDIPTL